MSNICAIVVTYNRLEKLKKALLSYEKQILKPKYLIVVNNASTDGTELYLNEWQKTICDFKKIVLSLPDNIGGSGGFYEGQKYAMQLDGIEWIMLADDDAYLDENYLSAAMSFKQYGFRKDDISTVCGLLEQYGNCDNYHRVTLKPDCFMRFCEKIQFNGMKHEQVVTDVDLISYVGPIINIEKLRLVGLVKKDYFIWMDDYEHSIRLSKVGKMICFTNTKIVHDVEEAFYDRGSSLNWKFYYGIRNKVDMFRCHFKLEFLIGTLIMVVYAIFCPLIGKPFRESKIRLIAIKDGIFGNLGKHPLYKPGWKP